MYWLYIAAHFACISIICSTHSIRMRGKHFHLAMTFESPRVFLLIVVKVRVWKKFSRRVSLYSIVCLRSVYKTCRRLTKLFCSVPAFSASHLVLLRSYRFPLVFDLNLPKLFRDQLNSSLVL